MVNDSKIGVAIVWTIAGVMAGMMAGGAFGPGVVSGAEVEAGEEFFERKVRPLLVQHCFACHGKGQKKGGLSLDSRDALLAGGDSGPALQLERPAESLLLEAIEYRGDVQMPPAGRLTDQEVAVFKQWAAAGAPWPKSANATPGGIRTDGQITDSDRQFWSFRRFERQPLPPYQDLTWPRSRIDPFVAAKRDAEGLPASPEADRRTLLRRAAFDLTGLPPSNDDLQEFVQDDAPDAFERALDRLLASPRHGERWARHWLDVARYGEDQAHTFAARAYPQGFRYRDWVIGAFNRDLPYDRFVFDQIAGDLGTIDGASLAPEAAEARRIETAPALGFFALGPVYYADAGCAPKAQADEWDDRIDTFGRGFLGLTLACARCHDHKFDPIGVHDYFALAGVFASSNYAETPLVAEAEVRQFEARTAAAKQSEQALQTAQAAAARQASEAAAPQSAKYLTAGWTLLNRRKTDGKATAKAIADELGLHEPFVEAWRKHLSSENGDRRKHLAAFDQLLAGQDAKVDLSADPAARQAVEAVGEALQQAVVAAVELRKKLEAEHAAAVAAAPEAEKGKVAKPQLDKDAAELLKQLLDDGPAPFHVPKDKAAALSAPELRAQLEELSRQLDEARKAVGPKYPIAHSLSDGSPKDLQIHLRGNHKTLGDKVARRFLRVLVQGEPAAFQSGSGRLELARATAGRDNPLTARVMVNRVWQRHFGRGIVETPSNFGTLGAPPTHPELLDDLTARFVERDWSLKWLHRELASSAAYRQSSDLTAAGEERDPENRWLWRAARRRLDVEAWRDAMLHVTGQLDLSLGGPSANLNDPGHRRRTLYASVSRHELNGMLRLFDFPDPNLTSERRVITTVPMQQLFVLNSDFMIRQARALQTRAEADAAGLVAESGGSGGGDAAKVSAAYRRVYQREPSDEEREFCVEFVRRAAEDRSAKLSPWEQLAQALLAANEFLFVD